MFHLFQEVRVVLQRPAARFHSPPHAPRPPKRTCRSWCSIMQRRARASSWEIACRTKARRALMVGWGWFNLPPLTLRGLMNTIGFPSEKPLFLRGGVRWGRLTSHDGMGGEIGWDRISQSSVGWVFDLFFSEVAKEYTPENCFKKWLIRGLGPVGLGFESGLPLSNDQSLSFSGNQSESKPPNQTTN